jgi:predicted DNA-binding protein
MQRTVLLVRPDQREKLARLAKSNGVSVAEIARRAIDAYMPELEEKIELDELVELVAESHKQALISVRQARQEVRRTLDYFGEKKAATE